MFIYMVFIYLPCIITQQQTTTPFGITHIISSSNHQTPILYQGSVDCCEGDRNSDIIRLLHPYQTIHYCNQSDCPRPEHISLRYYNFWSHFKEVTWYSYFLLIASYLYKSTWTKILQFWFVNRLASLWYPLSQVSALYYYY